MPAWILTLWLGHSNAWTWPTPLRGHDALRYTRTGGLLGSGCGGNTEGYMTYTRKRIDGNLFSLQCNVGTVDNNTKCFYKCQQFISEKKTFFCPLWFVKITQLIRVIFNKGEFQMCTICKQTAIKSLFLSFVTVKSPYFTITIKRYSSKKFQTQLDIRCIP